MELYRGKTVAYATKVVQIKPNICIYGMSQRPLIACAYIETAIDRLTLFYIQLSKILNVFDWQLNVGPTHVSLTPITLSCRWEIIGKTL